MDVNKMNALDKIQAKRLGITAEEYKDKEQMARIIWCKLISKGKVYNPLFHVPIRKRMVVIETVGIIALFYMFLLIYNAIANVGAETKEAWIMFSVSIVIYLIGEFAMYYHDMKEFEKYITETELLVESEESSNGSR